MATERFGFPYIAADQAQKHVTHNAALVMLDATLGGVVASASVIVAPTSPAEGEAYILPAGVSGFGAAAAGDVAIWSGGVMSTPVLSAGARATSRGSPRARRSGSRSAKRP